MRLASGLRLGPYEIVGFLGAGGMGEVYRARDTRLGRSVALKTLPEYAAASPDRLNRFEQEARAASALNHPAILTVFDVGSEQGTPYVVSELLEGATLRGMLEAGLPLRKALDYAVQLAHGLAAAHEQGIVHRDLKPENLFVTRDGHLKILDFGLAKLRREMVSDTDTATATRPGVVMGTAPYMSPEQVRGQAVDHRSDLFSFGTILFEMLSGRRPFEAETAAETMTAILKQDPPELRTREGAPALQNIVRRCLEKAPEQRFQSARDVGFALEAVSDSSGMAGITAVAPRRRLPITLALVVATVAAASFFGGRKTADVGTPSFQRLTFRRGTTWSARFAPDGRTIYYGAAWDGGPIQIFSTRTDSPESRSLDLVGSDVLAVSSQGEMAVSQRRDPWSFPSRSYGTLARVALAGGAPREVLEGVQGADWSRDGKELAVVRVVKGRRRLEYPIGHVLYESERVMMEPRVSPRGDQVAFIESDDERGDEYRSVSIVDRAGKRRRLTQGWRWMNTLAWEPAGREVWFAASEAGPHCSLWAASLGGKRRLLVRFPAFALIQDIAPDGRVLVALAHSEVGVMGVLAGDTRERDLSWLDLSGAADLSPDGRTLLGLESGEGTRRQRTIYLRRSGDSSLPVRLGEGFPLALSPDSKWVLARAQDSAAEIVLLPTGPGERKVLTGQGTEYASAMWAAGGERVLLTGREPGRPWRSFVMDLEGHTSAVTPEGVVGSAISPDGRAVVGLDPSRAVLLFGVDGGPPRVAPGPPEPGEIAVFSVDGRWLFVTETEGLVIQIARRELATGRREAWKQVTPADPTGIRTLDCLLSADGHSYAYNFWRSISSLYLVEGLQ
jgi:Tol biopolymer transport system component